MLLGMLIMQVCSEISEDCQEKSKKFVIRRGFVNPSFEVLLLADNQKLVNRLERTKPFDFV